MGERKFNIGDKVISNTCMVGVIHDLFDNEMYGVLFNDKILDTVPEHCLRPYYDDEISVQPKNLFKGAKFGDKFFMKCGNIALYVGVDKEMSEQYVRNIYGLVNDDGEMVVYPYEEDGTVFGKKDNEEDGSDIILKWKEDKEDKEDLKDELEVLRMSYLSQVSMWKSKYENEKKKNKLEWDDINELATESCLYDKTWDNEAWFSYREGFFEGFHKALED